MGKMYETPIVVPKDYIVNPKERGMFGRTNLVNIKVRNIVTGEIESDQNSNLIVYRGRDWLLQRAYNAGFGTGARDAEEWEAMWINWLAVGTGGSVGGNPLTPTSPALPDYVLNTHGSVDAGSNYITVGGKEYHTFDSGFPKFLHDTDVTETVYGPSFTDYNGVTNPSDSVLIGLVKVTLSSEECNGGTEDTDYQDISEAGLFVSSSASVGSPPTQLELFARVCFSTVRKNNEREIILSWFTYF